MRPSAPVHGTDVFRILVFEEGELILQLLEFARRHRDPALKFVLVRPQAGDKPPHQRGFPIIRIQQFQCLTLVLLVLFDPIFILMDLFTNGLEFGLTFLDLFLIGMEDRQGDTHEDQHGEKSLHGGVSRQVSEISSATDVTASPSSRRKEW